MTSTITPALDAVPVAAGEAVPVPRPGGPTAGCAVLTLAVVAVAVTDPAHPVWTVTALALAAITVGWGGGPVVPGGAPPRRRHRGHPDRPRAARRARRRAWPPRCVTRRTSAPPSSPP